MRIEKTFGSGFSWSEAVDAAADTYNGVGQTGDIFANRADVERSTCSGQCLLLLGLQSGVSVGIEVRERPD